MPDQDAMMRIAELERRVSVLEALVGLLDIRIRSADSLIDQAVPRAVQAACDAFDQRMR